MLSFWRSCISVMHFVVCFFFFKQKTAYEMRISDWSSDVCSSDLRRIRADRPLHLFQSSLVAIAAGEEPLRGKRHLSASPRLRVNLFPYVSASSAPVPNPALTVSLPNRFALCSNVRVESC